MMATHKMSGQLEIEAGGVAKAAVSEFHGHMGFKNCSLKGGSDQNFIVYLIE